MPRISTLHRNRLCNTYLGQVVTRATIIQVLHEFVTVIGNGRKQRQNFHGGRRGAWRNDA